MAGNESRNNSRNKHQSISLSLATLARVVGRLRTSLYQPFAGSHSGPTVLRLDLRPKTSNDNARPLAKIILFPVAIRPSTAGQRAASATDNLLVYTDAWYSRTVAK